MVVASKSISMNHDGLGLMGAERDTYNAKAVLGLVYGMWTLLDVHAVPAY